MYSHRGSHPGRGQRLLILQTEVTETSMSAGRSTMDKWHGEISCVG